MKKTILTYLIIVLIPLNSYCSFLSAFRQLKKTLQGTTTLTSFKEKLIQKNKDFTTKDSVQILNRQLDFNCRQISYEIEVYYNGDTYFGCRAILITRNDTIIYGRLQLLNYDDKIILKSTFEKNKSEISNYLKQHRQLYKLNVKTKDFKRDLTKQLIFGFGCSNGGNFYPAEAKKMLQYVSSQNHTKLSKWTRQINPELQAYGTLGLMRIQNNEIKLTNEELIIINHLKERNTKIYSCSGCIYGLRFDFNKVITWDKD